MNPAALAQPPLFTLGRVLTTPGASAALTQVRQSPQVFVTRHAQGDWSEMAPDDQQANVAALRTGRRLFSAYTLPNGIRLWVMTAANRAVTKVLLPLEYEQEEMTMSQVEEVSRRLAGCQSTNHTECYGELWQCVGCGKTVCYAEGTDNRVPLGRELCDDCWAARFAPASTGKQPGVICQEDNTLLLDCACGESDCATWLALTPDGVLVVTDKDGLCVSLLLPTWLDEVMRTAMVAQVQPAAPAEATPT